MAMQREATSRETIASSAPAFRPALLVAFLALAIAYLGWSFHGPRPVLTPHGAIAVSHGQPSQHLAARDPIGRAFAVSARPDPRVPPPPPGISFSIAAWTVPGHFIAAQSLPTAPVDGVTDRPNRANPPRAPPCLTV
ncbi:hypothetical protein [Allorhizobium taibaishanense]|uniref:Uncharacterized protein n=1 Tax=Allorhizobium taibaishanense TaxID=887144 RepID=A0A1Q9A9X7_9HYPH|nr:hypothetical protein [Allorhizobium taibaishanense]MBB4010014.1 hypothetical protein [Allorhizobium taibaishanense]OLP51626.1 hypothetical protein BJF91_16470 [Allorhizobium taibaishanense]